MYAYHAAMFSIKRNTSVSDNSGEEFQNMKTPRTKFLFWLIVS